nr:PREDICTED: protein D1-like [Bemisia tabaci]XP_018905790.1 PREDICTED: protein D1-like [Bemisia tabaci]XP_018905791.1 PREDICTED: protein D1-like [Bemisia tabaci]XP_018905793.1 PREDICTED: protein D1-like [Bemisia tabaci]XP_018905794.1 PREDICTED: protein D1-like [Bemisia tabaci]XP_018905795.1 PREDICTED: protein D1-like [Bemisia tabaci]XP_018905796.1 PREDICTED: protein D1-like [Bemisia tabaci]
MQSRAVISILTLVISISVNGSEKKKQKWNPKYPRKTSDEIKKLFEEHEIVPDVIDASPPHVLQVGYTSAKVVVDFGNNITRMESREAPTFLSWPAERKRNYTLIMIDPDYPSRRDRKKERQWHHWLVVDIPGNTFIKGTILSEYIPVEAKNNTGIHRYVFLVYEQPRGEIKYEEIHTIAVPVDSLRSPFSCREFAEKYNMTGPVAGNFFLSQYGKLYRREEIDPKYARKLRLEKMQRLEKDYTKKNYKMNKQKKKLINAIKFAITSTTTAEPVFTL